MCSVAVRFSYLRNLNKVIVPVLEKVTSSWRKKVETLNNNYSLFLNVKNLET